MIMQVHDEVVLDFPYHKDKGNLPKIRKIQRMLGQVGNSLNPPTPVPFGIEYHLNNWSEGEVVV
jgi:DNA polymerase I-like protein with 3'-5' exonuclease and polymerase domains